MLNPKKKTEDEKKKDRTDPEGTEKDNPEESEASLEKLLEDPKLKAEYDARIKEAVEAALAESVPEGEENLDVEEPPAEDQDSDESEETDEKTKQLDLETREKNLLEREMRATAVEELTKEQLPTALAECFCYDSEEAYQQSKEKVTKAFQEALNVAVNVRLRGKKIPGNSGEGVKGDGNAKKTSFASIVKEERRKR